MNGRFGLLKMDASLYLVCNKNDDANAGACKFVVEWSMPTTIHVAQNVAVLGAFWKDGNNPATRIKH